MASLLKISEAASLALHTVCLLASRPHEHLSVKDLAKILSASEHHLAKVMQRLAKEGIVSSVRGPRGGFRIARDLQTLTLLDVFEAVEGPIGEPGCLLSLDHCIISSCMLGDVLVQVNTMVRERLKSLKLVNFIIPT